VVVVVSVVLALAATVAAAVLLGDDAAEEATPTTTEAPCTPRPYQPCGAPPAPGTDGRRCLDGRDDYDGVATNGCEAVADGVDGTELVDRLAATIVPADDVDRYPLEVRDTGDLLCDGTLRLRLVAPPRTALRLVLLDDAGEPVGETTSADGVPGELTVQEPRCFRDDSGTYVAEVSPIGTDRSAESYVLTRSGDF